MINVAGGAEWRDERFTIGAGGRPSWDVGPYAAQGFVSGSNGFPGFPDYTAGTWTRSNVALYGDVELRGPDDRWTVGGAVRFEHFDIFGATTNGKLSVRYGLGDAVSVRGGVSTGFRAPTPGQQNTLNVQTTIDPETLELVDSANVPSTFRAAELRGGQPLQPETSFNSTVGLVVDTGPFTLTADYFRVDVSNRLALSQTFTLTTDERALLLSEGITSAGTLAFFRFFINDFSSRTQGIDLVSTYTPPAFAGDTVFSVTMNYTDTAVTKESDLLGPGDILGLTRGVPKTRWNVALSQRVGRVGLLGRLNYYGSWVDHFDARFVRGPAAPVLDGRYIVRANKQTFRHRIRLFSEYAPPSPDAFYREFRSLVSNADVDQRFVAGHIVSPIGNCFALSHTGEVVYKNRLTSALLLPPRFTPVFKGSYQFLLLGIDAHDRILASHELAYLLVDVTKLFVPIRVLIPFQSLHVSLQRVTHFS